MPAGDEAVEPAASAQGHGECRDQPGAREHRLDQQGDRKQGVVPVSAKGGRECEVDQHRHCRENAEQAEPSAGPLPGEPLQRRAAPAGGQHSVETGASTIRPRGVAQHRQIRQERRRPQAEASQEQGPEAHRMDRHRIERGETCAEQGSGLGQAADAAAPGHAREQQQTRDQQAPRGEPDPPRGSGRTERDGRSRAQTGPDEDRDERSGNGEPPKAPGRREYAPRERGGDRRDRLVGPDHRRAVEGNGLGGRWKRAFGHRLNGRPRAARDFDPEGQGRAMVCLARPSGLVRRGGGEGRCRTGWLGNAGKAGPPPAESNAG